MVAGATGNVELGLATAIDPRCVTGQYALIGAEQSMAKQTDLTSVGMAGQDQIYPSPCVVLDPLRMVSQKDRAGMFGDQRLHICKRGPVAAADQIQPIASASQRYLFVVQDADTALFQVSAYPRPVADTPLVVSLYEVHGAQHGCFLGEPIPVFTPLGHMSIQQIAGDSDAVEGQSLDGPYQRSAIRPIGLIMKIGHLQDGESIEGLRKPFQLYFGPAHVKAVGVPPAVEQEAYAHHENEAQNVQQSVPFHNEAPETYTIAMIMKEITPLGFDFKITASDISLKSLMVGQQGFYGDNKVDGIPPAYLEKYFTKVEGGYQVKKELQDKIHFDYHNLMNDSGARNLDVVFCRNVLIYFDETAQLTVINRFWESMAPQSYLFIGHSESLFGMKTQFEFLKTEWACLYKKNR